jgi:alginate O-acetyltransferase complex protein AlgI
MLFNSYPFLFVFLPLTLLIFYGLRRVGRRDLCIPFLMLASLAFYSYWMPRDLPILLATVIWNFLFAGYLARPAAPGRKLALVAAISGNLGLLAYFKYFDFVVGNVAHLLGFGYLPHGVPLPIGISFFTFTQIAYIVDCYRSRECETKFVNYGLFVTVFPHLIAGPIIHHAQMRPQFLRLIRESIDPRMVALGVPILIVGLAKKVLLADNLAALADPVFAAADKAVHLSAGSAWLGVIAYTLQIYFDFSGYSDMAVGLGLLFGLKFPVNFDSPYRSTSIIEFWRRWHITLSTWLRDYLYFSLGGNRSGEVKRLRNVAITMLLGGIWHGAGWTFVIWGALHGAYIVVNHVARKFRPPTKSSQPKRMLGFAKWAVTMSLVMLAWVFFRAKSVPAAFGVLQSIGAGWNGADGIRALDILDYGWLLIAGAIALLAPNTQEIFDYSAQTTKSPSAPAYSFFASKDGAWSIDGTSVIAAVLMGALAAGVLASLWRPAIFIYFNF